MNNCYFYTLNRCRILTVLRCQGEQCPFRKTSDEYIRDYKKAEKQLADKNLTSIIVDGIVTVERKK